ncbi:hypothetical protein [Methanorbis rubei]|uniref:hypothetical protein n=1 Tax=Methanorbis rubei TaxID=3028300 RepID=UPI0030B8D5AD
MSSEKRKHAAEVRRKNRICIDIGQGFFSKGGNVLCADEKGESTPISCTDTCTAFATLSEIHEFNLKKKSAKENFSKILKAKKKKIGFNHPWNRITVPG